jgi:hypothetical protein
MLAEKRVGRIFRRQHQRRNKILVTMGAKQLSKTMACVIRGWGETLKVKLWLCYLNFLFINKTSRQSFRRRFEKEKNNT